MVKTEELVQDLNYSTDSTKNIRLFELRIPYTERSVNAESPGGWWRSA